MLQKIIKVGNSAGIIIPKDLRKKLGMKPGSKVIVEEGPRKSTLIVRKKGVGAGASSITPEFIDIIERINKRYSRAFRELAEK